MWFEQGAAWATKVLCRSVIGSDATTGCGGRGGPVLDGKYAVREGVGALLLADRLAGGRGSADGAARFDMGQACQPCSFTPDLAPFCSFARRGRGREKDPTSSEMTHAACPQPHNTSHVHSRWQVCSQHERFLLVERLGLVCSRFGSRQTPREGAQRTSLPLRLAHEVATWWRNDHSFALYITAIRRVSRLHDARSLVRPVRSLPLPSCASTRRLSASLSSRMDRGPQCQAYLRDKPSQAGAPLSAPPWHRSSDAKNVSSPLPPCDTWSPIVRLGMNGCESLARLADIVQTLGANEITANAQYRGPQARGKPTGLRLRMHRVPRNRDDLSERRTAPLRRRRRRRGGRNRSRSSSDSLLCQVVRRRQAPSGGGQATLRGSLVDIIAQSTEPVQLSPPADFLAS